MLNKNFGPYAIILTPSKELCIQLESLCKKLLMGIPYMKTALLIGGAPYPNQFYRLRSGVQIVIATPSRLLEILRKLENDSEELEFETKKKKKAKNKSSSVNYLSWDLVSFLVIDEIDQIINYGEEETIRNILDRLKTLNRSNHYKQTIVASDENNYIQINKSKKSANNLIHSIQVSLFSSTIPPKIVPICRKFLNSSYITLSVKDEEEIATSLSESLHLTSNKKINMNSYSESSSVSNSISTSLSSSLSSSLINNPTNSNISTKSSSSSIANNNHSPVIPNLS
jgi:superfamily II DNA/RNA helicase